MIVLDENLDEQRVRAPLAARCKGKVISVRAGTVIKDEAIPAMLCHHRPVTFVTTNVTDFWRRIPAHRRYCIVCLPLPTHRQTEIPDLLNRLLRQAQFQTARLRMGKVIRATWSEIQYYQIGQRTVTKLAWA